MAEPITVEECRPDHVLPEKPSDELHDKLVHYGIFDIVNSLLKRYVSYSPNWKEVVVVQNEVVSLIRKKHSKYKNEDEIIDDDLLEFDIFYRQNGWHVTYQRQGYLNDGPSHWTFTKPGAK